MKKKLYIQPVTEVAVNFYREDVMFGTSNVSGDGPVDIGQGEEGEEVDPSAPIFNAWEQEL